VVLRIIAGLMSVLLAYAAALNVNDPDPVRWVAMYGAAGIVSLIVAYAGSVPIVAPAAVGGVALVWALLWASRVPSLDAYSHMFDSWEMKSATVEEARETCGLLIVAAWMLAIALRLILAAE
jgi:hypothetical protein